MLSLLTPHHVRLRSEIEYRINEDQLTAQIAEKTIDVKAVLFVCHGYLFFQISLFILDILGRLCAPARDETIAILKKEADVVLLMKYVRASLHLFRGIFELLDVMKDDMANFSLTQNRAVVEEYSQKLERDQFLEYLKRFPGKRFVFGKFCRWNGNHKSLASQIS